MVGTYTHLLRRIVAASIVAMSGLIVGAPSAAADPCPPLDLGCVAGDATTVDGVVDDTTSTVIDVVDDTEATVGGVVADATTTVGGVVDDTTTTAGGVVGGGAPIDPPTILHGSPPGGTVPDGGAGPGTDEMPPGGGTTPSNGGGSTHIGRGSSGSSVAPKANGAVTGSRSTSPVSTGGSATTGHPFPRVVDGGGGALHLVARLVKVLAIPLTLILLVIGFVLVQDRIDRRDPKLVFAPAGSDKLTFS